MSHPNYDILVSYIENSLDDAEREKVGEHLAQPCPHCNTKMARLRSVLAVTAADKTVAPPVDVLKRAIALSKKTSTSPLQPVLRVLAKLQFDSRLQLSSLPTRGVVRSHQMLFTTDRIDIDLQITPENGEYNLVGQVLGSIPITDVSPAFVCLQQKVGPLVRGTETDSLGQFTFRQVPSGIYDLVFELGSQEVMITSLEFNNDQG